ncbi:branched-chain amino acid transport system II carrier protein [Dokdonia genika]|jgi:LIVCS family branched-chain amino acid:cation transporter|uniref:Branched-chain amino acid transport system II carrier protein n=1 Tax=Dokdonia genika TaxID=308113 RepID=A0ABV9L8T8_9FLAO|nr:branched-chain amino acid transport system carrier protein [uncultured bacterium]AOE06431.1 branched-chain amino acid transport system carrier protein [uncultured bacterium]MDE0598300.1 branched-chain amino acid transport system II carrier protein [Dokdonia donghaensis]
MRMTKQTFITAFALFSLFFGAGNLILPPFLGYNAGSSWWLVLLGFIVSAVVIPILAIYGHARLQGTMLDFAKKVSPLFALLYGVIVYAISIALPAPRTASVTYEMAIQPYFDISSLTLSSLYFILVLVFVLNRSKMMDIVGKYLTPAILIILAIVIGVGLFGEYEPMRASIFDNTITSGILEGYQTFDAIGGVVVGGVIVISLGFKNSTPTENKRIITQGGIIAGLGLLFIYGGLIYLGALRSGGAEVTDRTALLSMLSVDTLGAVGSRVLAVLVSLACFTTAVGIVTGTSDFVKGIFNNSQLAYNITAVLGCVLGVVMGQLDVMSIIAVAVPALMFIYPITIVLIILNSLPDKWTTVLVFRSVVIATILFSAPDFWASLGFSEQMKGIQEFIPLGTVSLGWLLPAVITLIAVNVFTLSRKRTT